jgi:hypothetical protein
MHVALMSLLGLPRRLADKMAMTPEAAAGWFLREMRSIAKTTFPAWYETFLNGIEGCALDEEARCALLEPHRLGQTYFAAVVALETATVCKLFPADEAAELLTEIAAQADQAARRQDHFVSDLVFHVVGRTGLTARLDHYRKPYDQVMTVLLAHMGVDRNAGTAALMSDAYFLHNLGAPLALHVPHWWARFAARFALRMPAVTAEKRVFTLADGRPLPRRRTAVSLFHGPAPQSTATPIPTQEVSRGLAL